jgi:argininosuccinate lyase
MKAWEGRFTGSTDPLMERFSASHQFDRKLYEHDIQGSIAYAEMLEKTGILTNEESARLARALTEVRAEIAEGRLAFSDGLEDIHMHIESRLIEKVGDLGKKLHTGRSRNDQVSIDMRLYVKAELSELGDRLTDLMRALLDRAGEEKATLLPGYTHTRRAQVVTFGHHLLAYYFMCKRDRERVLQARSRADVLTLGSGALAGSTIPIDREFLKERLGFARVSENSMDAVADRDFVLDALYAAAVIMLHLSRLAEDLILFSTEEFQFISLPDELCTGSSLMPHKKNPDALELIRGKAGRTTGDLMGLFATVKGLPMTYNRDLQEDKEPLFHGVETAKDALAVAALAIRGFTVDRERMERAARESYMPAVEAAEYLAARGVPFREAHHIVGTMVRECEAKRRFLWQMTVDEFRVYSPAFEEDIVRLMDPNAILSARKTAGGASVEEVEKQIAAEKRYLSH